MSKLSKKDDLDKSHLIERFKSLNTKNIQKEVFFSNNLI